MIEIEVISKLLLGLLNGVSWGLIIALIALGLSLILGLMEIVNMAHGEFYMIGAVLTFYIVLVYGFSFWIALIIAPLFLAALGVMLERGVLRPVEGMPLRTIVVTLGLSFILVQTTLLIFGGTAYRIPSPTPGNIELAILGYSTYRVVGAIISVVCLMFVLAILYRTKMGLWIRAAQQHFEMAQALGINVKYVNTVAFALGSAIAGLGGVMAAPIVGVEYIMGTEMLLLAFIIVLVGGLGSIKGTIVAGIIIGVIESTGGIFLSPTFARAITLGVLIVIMATRPRGLFGVW